MQLYTKLFFREYKRKCCDRMNIDIVYERKKKFNSDENESDFFFIFFICLCDHQVARVYVTSGLLLQKKIMLTIVDTCLVSDSILCRHITFFFVFREN